jgi:hypothetical protein
MAHTHTLHCIHQLIALPGCLPGWGKDDRQTKFARNVKPGVSIDGTPKLMVCNGKSNNDMYDLGGTSILGNRKIS